MDISSTDLAEELIDGICGCGRGSRLDGARSALLERGVPGVGASLVPHLAEPGGGGGDAEAPVAQVADRLGQLVGVEVLFHQRVVGDEDPVLQGEVHRGGGLAAAGRRDQDHVGLVERPHALAVVVLDGVLDRRHPSVVALDVAQPVQPGGYPLTLLSEDRLDLGHVQVEEVDQRTARPVQLVSDLGHRGGGEGQRRDRTVHGRRRGSPRPSAPPRPW